MTENEGLRRYLQAGLTFTEVTRGRADELLRELIKTGETEHKNMQDRVEYLVRTSRDRSGNLVSTVRDEVPRRLKELDVSSVKNLAKKVGNIVWRSPGTPRKVAGQGAKEAPSRKVPASKTTAKRSPAKKALAKKTADRKDPAKNTTKTVSA